MGMNVLKDLPAHTWENELASERAQRNIKRHPVKNIVRDVH